MFSDSNIYLYGVGGTYAGSIFQLAQEITIIGRDSSRCAILYTNNEPGISSVHCQLQPVGNCVEITDLGSKYGTFMENGIKLDKHVPYTLENGACFYLGDKKNKFIVKVKA